LADRVPVRPPLHPHRRGLVVELLPIVGIALLFWFMIIRPQ
jgi:preprotein translocase subunit YajC